MTYSDVLPGEFISRPNRFIAHVLIGGREQVCHVKNTGRCRELLVPGAEVYVQARSSPGRKTPYDLITVRKGNILVNIDSAAPNALFREWLCASGYLGKPTLISPETKFGNSRLDYYIEASGRRIFVEVKGVTLEEGGIARFPDAPTERGVKHMHELIACKNAGFDACAAFVIQMDGMRYFEPNWQTHPQFGQALAEAAAAGVQLVAFQCRVTEDSVTPAGMVEIRL